VTPSLRMILQHEADPSLFHQSLGMLNPLTGILELGKHAEEIATDRSDYHQESLSYLAALLHERHHWLQLIGTTSGLFLTLLLELQSALLYSSVDVRNIDTDQLPLLDTLKEDDVFAYTWGMIECLRLSYFGSRPGDYEGLRDKGMNPQVQWISGLLYQIVSAAFGGTAAEPAILSLWEAKAAVAADEGRIKPVRYRGWLVGARHLMECGARINEMTKLAAGTPGSDQNEIAPYFAGIYGIAHDIFCMIHGEPSTTKELALSYLCDLSLNTFAPPVAPLLPAWVGREGWSPARLFVTCANSLKGFNFERPCSFQDPDSVNDFVQSISDHLSRSEAGTSISMIAEMTSNLLDDMNPVIETNDMYRVVEGSLPEPTTPGSTHKYFISRCVAGRRIRSENPGFFAVPGAWYVKDRALFHELFDQVAPPLARYGSYGIGLTQKRDPGWLEFFIEGALQREITRGVMFFDTKRLAQRLRSFANVASAPDYGKQLITHIIRSFLGASLGESLITDMFPE
jgi:hypothetical protein